MPRAVFFFLVLTMIMLLIPVVFIPFWANKIKKIESEIKVSASGKVDDVLLSNFHKAIELGFMLTILMMVSLSMAIVIYIILTIRVGRREMALSAELRKQNMEATQEMNEEAIRRPKVDSAYHLRQKDAFVDDNESASENLPLTGKKILLIEDDTTAVTISQRVISTLGATAHICRNARESVQYVCKILRDQHNVGPSTPSPPFDYILMDCEKLKISGFAATVCIRKELTYYGFRIPFMALTVHSDMEVMAKISNAEMDYYLPKPLKPELLLEAIDYLECERAFRRS